MWGPEAGDPPGPSFPKGLLNELTLRGRVYPPKGTFPRLLLRPRHLDEVPVQRQVVADRVLREKFFGFILVFNWEGRGDRLWQSGAASGQSLTCQPLSAVR